MTDSPQTRLATRLAFIASGFAMAAWAPLVPFAKANTQVDEAGLGLLLLCLGLGSIAAMPLTGWLNMRIGSKPLIIAGGIGLALCLPALALIMQPALLGAALFVFGASLGTIDVAMNVHAIEVERGSKTPLMSGFHAMFSVGAFLGAGGVTLLLYLGLSPLVSMVFAAAFVLGAIIMAAPRLLTTRPAQEAGAPAFVLPRGMVLLLALLTGAAFLVEGAMLDWGAVLIVGMDLVRDSQGGLGYMLFSVAMTIGRFSGDRVVGVLGQRRVLTLGGALTIAGLALLLLSPFAALALAGFVLIGFGASNIVPVLFSLAGQQQHMPTALAIASVTTVGYAGILLGPALVGGIAHLIGLPAAFWMLAALTLTIPLSAAKISRS